MSNESINLAAPDLLFLGAAFDEVALEFHRRINASDV